MNCWRWWMPSASAAPANANSRKKNSRNASPMPAQLESMRIVARGLLQHNFAVNIDMTKHRWSFRGPEFRVERAARPPFSAARRKEQRAVPTAWKRGERTRLRVLVWAPSPKQSFPGVPASRWRSRSHGKFATAGAPSPTRGACVLPKRKGVPNHRFFGSAAGKQSKPAHLFFKTKAGNPSKNFSMRFSSTDSTLLSLAVREYFD